jgi:hypothetical protein
MSTNILGFFQRKKDRGSSAGELLFFDIDGTVSSGTKRQADIRFNYSKKPNVEGIYTSWPPWQKDIEL